MVILVCLSVKGFSPWLLLLVSSLSAQHKQVAIDVEQDSTYSYRGITCLVQLATREANYLIDPFNMFSQMNILNKITTNPSVLKILHHAEMDVCWLQVRLVTPTLDRLWKAFVCLQGQVHILQY